MARADNGGDRELTTGKVNGCSGLSAAGQRVRHEYDCSPIVVDIAAKYAGIQLHGIDKRRDLQLACKVYG